MRFRVDAGLTSSLEQLTHSLVSSVVDLRLVGAADAPQLLEADVLLRALGPRTPPPLPPVFGPPLVAPPIGLTRDTTAPVISGLYAARVFALGTGRAAVTSVRHTLSEAAFVRIVVAKPQPARRLGSICKAPSRALARVRPCTRYKTVTRLGQSGRGGPERTAVQRARGPPATRAGQQPDHDNRDRRRRQPVAAAQRALPRAAAVAPPPYGPRDFGYDGGQEAKTRRVGQASSGLEPETPSLPSTPERVVQGLGVPEVPYFRASRTGRDMIPGGCGPSSAHEACEPQSATTD